MITKELALDLAVMLVGSGIVSLIVCILYFRNKNVYHEIVEENQKLQDEFEADEVGMKIYSTPSKADKYVIRSKEIEDEEK